MDIPVRLDGFEGRSIVLRTGFFSNPGLVVDGVIAKPEKGRYVLTNSKGEQVEVRVKTNWVDPVPKLDVAGRIVTLARPLKWYEWVWIGLPVLMVFAGGALGALLGLAATYCNVRVMRSAYPAWSKFIMTAAITGGAVGVFFVLFAALRLVLGR
ncbi:MAG: hypothetical protein HY673_23625 [Chloroflexi bacterium]|nr:hypothetical protein [Chloroflexota bacterium]